MLSDPVDSAPEPFTAPTTCSRCYRANNKTTRERENLVEIVATRRHIITSARPEYWNGQPGDLSIGFERIEPALQVHTKRNSMQTSTRKGKKKTQRHAQSWSVPCWLWPFLPFIYSRWPINTRLHRVRVSSVSIHYSRRKFSLIFCCCCYFAHSDGRHVTCGTAETSGIAQVGKEFTTADVVEQHVEKGLVVMSPHPGQKKKREIKSNIWIINDRCVRANRSNGATRTCWRWRDDWRWAGCFSRSVRAGLVWVEWRRQWPEFSGPSIHACSFRGRERPGRTSQFLYWRRK